MIQKEFAEIDAVASAMKLNKEKTDKLKAWTDAYYRKFVEIDQPPSDPADELRIYNEKRNLKDAKRRAQ